MDYRALADTVSESPAKNEILLPEYTDDGRPVKWMYTRDYTWLVVMAAVAAVFIAIYRSRFETVEKEEKTAQNQFFLSCPRL